VPKRRNDGNARTQTSHRPETLVKEGDVLAKKYRVERKIGEGGMGVVYAAHHLELDERVALKFMQPEKWDDTKAVARFLREARAAAKIKSEHVVRVIDVCKLKNRALYIVMEYLEGSDLSVLLRTSGRVPVDRAVTYLLQACEAIAEAHALGIVHRDLKPGNLFLANRRSGPPIVKVLDFGLSKNPRATGQPDLTEKDRVVGSPLYMSPEQMQSSSVDARSDVWALGIVLYELLAGVAPFQGESLSELQSAIFHLRHAPLRSLSPVVPREVEAAIDRCLSKDPADRFPGVGELAIALAPFGSAYSDVSLKRILQVLGVGGSHSQPGRVVVVPPSKTFALDSTAMNEPSAPGLPSIVVVGGATNGERRHLHKDRAFVVGRALDADLRLPEDDRKVSREHAVIEPARGAFVVRDLESRNGTWLNSTKVDHAVTLKHGDELRFGRTIVRVDLGAEAETE
jgi:serine/threonine-protein kinase